MRGDEYCPSAWAGDAEEDAEEDATDASDGVGDEDSTECDVVSTAMTAMGVVSISA